ncbi:unnamed protein product [Mytilus coruscus]|uniref:CCHC-type domain-containing protein n=1 Tax=Mytilus coruscus TaxID=42192 RepID=A0A6J8EBP1_MYTCO|nr:unnamed protein product [Mytilus coruscus]
MDRSNPLHGAFSQEDYGSDEKDGKVQEVQETQSRCYLYDSDNSIIADSLQTSTPYWEELFGRAIQNAWSSESGIQLDYSKARPTYAYITSESESECSKVAPNDVRQKGYEYASVYRDTKLPVQKFEMQRPLYERPMHVPPQYDTLRPHIVEPEGYYRRKQKEPDSVDGKCSEWVDYIIHFEQVASWNQWTDREKAQQLTMCLRGYAQKILSDLTLGQLSDYNALKNVLSQRFNPREGEVAYRCEFRNRRRQKDETVAEYGYGLRRLAQQAYRIIRYHEIEPTVVDHPVDKIVNPRETIDAHNIQTLQALTENEQQNPESKILGQISQLIDNKFKEYLNENRTVDTNRNRIGSYNEPNRNEGQGFYNRSSQPQNRFDRQRDITCYYCHEFGHIRTRCPY